MDTVLEGSKLVPAADWMLMFMPARFLGSRLGILTGSKAFPRVLGRPRCIWGKGGGGREELAGLWWGVRDGVRRR